MGCGSSGATTLAVDGKLVATPARIGCSSGADCGIRGDAAHCQRFAHPGDADYVPRPSCAFGEDCPSKNHQDHRLRIAHPGDVDYTGPKKVCRLGGECTNTDPTHLRRFVHPRSSVQEQRLEQRKACKFGLKCFRRSGDHIKLFAHPGDSDYRRGRVIFEDGALPEFETLRQLFDFCDPSEYGNFSSKEMLCEAVELLKPYCKDGSLPKADVAWTELGGDTQTFVGFAKFAAWARQRETRLPIGVEVTVVESDVNAMSCGFIFPDGRRCECQNFCAARNDGETGKVHFCACGHKRSMHAVRKMLPGTMAPLPSYWTRSAEGLVRLDERARARFQDLFDHTLKSRDNWTRDRGCALHGVNKCPAASPKCMFNNPAPVPTGYRVTAVMRNQNKELWGYYALNRGAVAKECEEQSSGHAFRPIVDVETVSVLLEDAPSVDSCNEWFLFHGSSDANCQNIMKSNFKLSLAGTGATWKDGPGSKGTPLYGFGIYFAERVTKADEYSDMVQAGSPFEGSHTMIVCRVTGGRAQYCDSNEIDPVLLQRNVISGPFHSVFGDRVSKLKKPYREVVVYDATQCYPEYLVYYKRLYS